MVFYLITVAYSCTPPTPLQGFFFSDNYAYLNLLNCFHSDRAAVKQAETPPCIYSVYTVHFLSNYSFFISCNK